MHAPSAPIMPQLAKSRGNHYPLLIVGGGQSGLSLSWYMKRYGVDHLVLEKDRAASAWRNERWDTFCLVTPNWQCQLPGYPYAGRDPHGFMVRDEIVEYLDGYVKSFDPPLRNGITVNAVSSRRGGGFKVVTTYGVYTCDQLAIASGGYQIPILPDWASRLPTNIAQTHSSAYRNPNSLPEGAVLVVGSGQSGAQIAEDLHLAGRKVVLCVGDAPRVARRYRGKDVVEWLHDMGYYDMPVDNHPLREGVRDKTNHYVTGRDGGRDIDLRRFAREGLELYGSAVGLEGSKLRLAPNLAECLDNADSTSENIKSSIDAYISKSGIHAPAEPRYQRLWVPKEEREELDLAAAGIASIVWCIGFRTDYSWVKIPAFDMRSTPIHRRGVSTVPGLYFLGLPWLHTWGSGRFSGIARDAEYLALKIVSIAGGDSLQPSICPTLLGELNGRQSSAA